MKTSIIAATTAALIAGSVATYAANPSAPPAGASAAPAAAGNAAPAAARDHQRWRITPADRAALEDARIASLKAGLKLTPDQEKLWPAVETALRDVAKDAATRRAELRKTPRPAGEAPDAIDRLRRQVDLMTARAADLTKIADAAEPLYKTLDEGQKQRLQILLRQDGPKGPHMQRHRPGEGPGGPRRG